MDNREFTGTMQDIKLDSLNWHDYMIVELTFFIISGTLGIPFEEDNHNWLTDGF